VPGYALYLYTYEEWVHNKKIREKKDKKGIALRDIASKVHLLARIAMPWQIGYMKWIGGVIMNISNQ